MSPSIILALFALVGCACAGSDVIDFTEKNFDEKIKDHSIILVEFFAPWCGHCKRLAPEYEKAATKLKSNDPPVPLAKVDCTSEKSVCDKFSVSGFPTLKIFRNGDLSADYEGPRDADGIVKYMRGQAGASSKELENLADIEKFLENEEHGIIGFFGKDSRLKDSFVKVADSSRDRFRFAHTSAKEILDKYGYNDNIVIFQPKRLHNKFEENQVKYTGSNDVDKIKKFLNDKMHGLCGIRSSDNFMLFQKPTVVVYSNIDWVKDLKGTQYWRNRVCKVASDYKDKVTFALSNKGDFSHEIDEYGLSDFKFSKNPFAAATNADGKKFGMKEEFSIESLKKFVDDFLANKLEPYMKSEPVPEDNSGPVKIAVTKNFEEVVSKDKDVLIEFYAPWCGHCKKLAPIYDELGEKLKDENVVIAKMDATANDVPSHFDVKGFPTIYWVPKGKKPVTYNGGREVKDFLNYIAKESTEPLKGYDRNGKKQKKEL